MRLRVQPRRLSVSHISEVKGDSEDHWPTMEEAVETIAACADDMNTLWTDAVVRDVLDHRGMRPEEGPGL